MSSGIKIKVMGHAGIGKTSVVSLILHALRAQNLNVDLSERISRDLSERAKERLDAAIEVMKNSRTPIEIEETEIMLSDEELDYSPQLRFANDGRASTDSVPLGADSAESPMRVTIITSAEIGDGRRI